MIAGKLEHLKRFFWPPVENDDYLYAASYRALVIFSMIGFFVSFWVIFRHRILEPIEITLLTEIVLISSPVLLLFPYLLYRKVSIKMVGRAFAIYTVLRLTVLAVAFGGIDSTQSILLIPVVLVATFVLGGREGFIGLLATFCVYVGLFLSQKSQISSPTELSELKQHFVQLCIVSIMIVGTGAAFRHQLVLAVENLIKAKASADASNMAKSEFLANMSHEIRTPMNGVLGMADVLKHTQLTPKQEMLVQTIDRSGNALLKIINDILDFSKIEAGKMEFESQPIDIREIIDDVSALLSTTSLSKDIDLSAKCAPDVPGIVCGDGGRIRQVLVNLVGNAIKFTDHGAVSISVTCVNEGEHTRLKVTVSDTGIGIPKDKLSGIFDKFSQGDGTTTRRYGGTGLGLAISKSLVTAMGGEIGLTSNLGKGSDFYFTLYLPIIEKAAKPHTPSLHNETKVPVLVIAGNEENKRRIVKTLATWGVQTVSASTGEKAMQAITKIAQSKFKFPMIVLDNELPDTPGMEILTLIRSTDRAIRTPVIFVQSQSVSLAAEAPLIDEADCSLGPSFSADELKLATYDSLFRPNSRLNGTASGVQNNVQSTNKASEKPEAVAPLSKDNENVKIPIDLARRSA